MRRIKIILKDGGITFNEVPNHWERDYIYDFLNKRYKNTWEDWEFVI